MSIVKKHSIETNDHVDLDRFRKKKKRRWLFVIGLIILALIVWYGTTIFLALNRIVAPNSNAGSNSVLRNINKEDASPVNVLLIGIGGESHPGGTLADSIMVASVDPKTKTISLISLPRDLYVSIPGDGKDKINSAHSFGENKSKGTGPAVLKQVVSETLGIPIHYFIRVDFDGFKKIIDTLGGVTVTVKKPINDPFFPDAQMKGYEPFVITAGVHTLDGKTALKYARSRETTSDFDRARRQQEIVSAIKDKMLSANVLANPKKVTDIITILGKHLLTDFSPGEFDQLITLAKQFDKPTVRSQVLDTSENGLLISSHSQAGAFILIPRAGTSDYSEIQLFARSFIAAPRIQAEKSSITLQPGTATKDQVTKIAKQLETAGFTTTISDTPASDAIRSTLYDYTAGKKTASLKFLKDTYTVSATTTKAQPSPAASGTSSFPDFLLVVDTDLLKTVKAQLKTLDLTESPPPLLSEGTTSLNSNQSAEAVTSSKKLD